jgi:glycerophosphoryl diester phosphodiesterase
VQLAHSQGLKVWVYTVNNARLAKRLLRAGVDGLITDNPSLIWKVMALTHR